MAYSTPSNSSTLSPLLVPPVAPHGPCGLTQPGLEIAFYYETWLVPPNFVISPIVSSPLRLLPLFGEPSTFVSTQSRNPVKPGGTGGIAPGSKPLVWMFMSSGYGTTARPRPTDQCVGCWRVRTSSKSVVCQTARPPILRPSV